MELRDLYGCRKALNRAPKDPAARRLVHADATPISTRFKGWSFPTSLLDLLHHRPSNMTDPEVKRTGSSNSVQEKDSADGGELAGVKAFLADT